MSSNNGVKFDKLKPRIGLIPAEAIYALATVLTAGAEKYADRNWEKGMDWERPFNALQRHMWAFWSGEDLDPELGVPHTWCAITELAFLIAYEARRAGTDNRAIQPTHFGCLPKSVRKWLEANERA